MEAAATEEAMAEEGMAEAKVAVEMAEEAMAAGWEMDPRAAVGAMAGKGTAFETRTDG